MVDVPDFSRLRREYETDGIDIDAVDADPVAQFATWFEQAVAAEVYEPNAMTVSTVDADGIPSARIVLMKAVDQRGVVFFTNYASAKGRALEASGLASATFGWLPLHRQVRIAGTVARVAEGESDEYFATRPRGSQIGAWASEQSRPIASRDELVRRWSDIDRRFGADGPIDRPAHWGGYRIAPTTIEFWQGQVNRMHDRLLYRRQGDAWSITRLQP